MRSCGNPSSRKKQRWRRGGPAGTLEAAEVSGGCRQGRRELWEAGEMLAWSEEAGGDADEVGEALRMYGMPRRIKEGLGET